MVSPLAITSSNSRVTGAFSQAGDEGRAALVGYLTAGHPDRATSAAALAGISEVVDVLEVGVPFSDPVADGQVIQRSSQIALEGGVGLPQVLELLADLDLACPVVLFSYLNPVLSYGVEPLQRDAREVGVDALLLTDLPGGSDDPAEAVLHSGPLDLVPLVAPNTPDRRVAALALRAQGFLYLVGRLGVTGVRSSLAEDLARTVTRVRRVSPVPVAVGFGIGTPEQARVVGSLADGVVVGSALVDTLERRGVTPMLELASELRRSLDGVAPQDDSR